MATKRKDTMWLNWNAISDISNGGKNTQSVGVLWDEQGVPHTLFAQTYGPKYADEAKRGKLVRDKNGNYCIAVKQSLDNGGQQIMTVWVDLDGVRGIHEGTRKSTIPVGYAFLPNMDGPQRTIFAMVNREGQLVTSKEKGLYGFNLRERLVKAAG